MDELFDSVSRPSNLQCQWQDGWPRPIVCQAYKFCLMVTYFMFGMTRDVIVVTSN